MVLIFISVLCPNYSWAQIADYPIEMPAVGNINFSRACFEKISENEKYSGLFLKFDSLLVRGDNSINIVHIGGSHIQADIYTHRIRQRL